MQPTDFPCCTLQEDAVLGDEKSWRRTDRFVQPFRRIPHARRVLCCPFLPVLNKGIAYPTDVLWPGLPILQFFRPGSLDVAKDDLLELFCLLPNWKNLGTPESARNSTVEGRHYYNRLFFRTQRGLRQH